LFDIGEAFQDMPSIQELTERIVAFRDARDWKQFHNPKDMALSLVLEAGEVMEHFQWKNEKEMHEYLESHNSEVGEEVADVLYWILLMGHDFGIDVLDALENKLKKNIEKYPIEKAKGKSTKYDRL
jgi:dCTP diphosphatase